MKKIHFAGLLILLTISSCKKFIDVGNPATQLTSSTVFSSDATATAAQLAIYAQMEGDGFFYNLSVATALSADEMINYDASPDRIDLYHNNLRPENTYTNSLWSRLYDFIYKANAVNEGVEKSKTMSEAVKKQLKGEALFVRAYCHFYLAQLFGEIPVIISTDYQQNAIASRQPLPFVYKQIEEDLTKAGDLLSAGYVDANNVSRTERTRPNVYASKALLARVYLFEEKWTLADAAATAVIGFSSQYALLPDINAVFLRNSQEAIWQVQSTFPGFNTYAGALYPFTGLPSNVSLTPSFVNGLDSADLRLSSWIKSITVGGDNYFYPYKYKAGQDEPSITEYTMVLRVAELYLIRAEARCRQSLFAQANADLNALRSRANLPNIALTSQAALLSEIEHQRRNELFAESGDRWIDLHRTGRLNDLMSIFKVPDWTSTDQLYPIPQVEIDRNKNLVQNPGY